MSVYRVIYVTISRNGLWVRKHEKYIRAENLNQIILELAKTVTSKFYLLEIWEEIVGDRYGSYRLVSQSETIGIQPLDRHLESYIKEIEKTIGQGITIHLNETYTKKLRKILSEMIERFGTRKDDPQ